MTLSRRTFDETLAVTAGATSLLHPSLIFVVINIF